MAAGAGCAAAGGARGFAKALRMEGLQRNPEPRGPAAQRPAAGAALGCSAAARPAPRRAGGAGLVFWAGADAGSPSMGPP